MPNEFKELLDEWEIKSKEINDQIITLKNDLEMVIMRIQLASPKTLQQVINQVDDMGDLSLFDSKIKSLTS